MDSSHYDECDDDFDNGFGGVDVETFQRNGYGGFGYDTSTVPADDKESEMVKALKCRDVDKMKRILGSKANDSQAKVTLLNHARRWTEVDYKMSGFTKEYEWFDLTPLARAALEGKIEAVEFLLKEGADPTLSGCRCPIDDVHRCYDSLSAAEATHKRAEQEIYRIVTSDPRDRRASSYIYFGEFNDPQERADHLFQKLENARKSQAMVKACKEYWQNARYASAQYSSTSRSDGYPNKPTDAKAMLAALETAKQNELDQEEQVKLDKRKEYVVKKLTVIQTANLESSH